LDSARLQTLSRTLDVIELEKYLLAFNQVCEGGSEAGAIGALPMAERFRWLTSTRSTIVQTSRVHPGLCDDAAQMLDQLYNRLVKD
jgi:Protein of unknown function (DUF3037)